MASTIAKKLAGFCEFEQQASGTWVCVVCGGKASVRCYRLCGQKPSAPLLGDRLAAFFASHGLTPESYAKWKADHGIDAILGKGCGCDRRKELLNKADAAVRGGAAKLRAFMGW